MGKQPAVLIIARHGTRLDQANKDWHSTAEQPWDSPLSYGGWIQGQNLGARIASELINLDTPLSSDGTTKETSPTSSRPRKRRKITIHSSPYLRCVQTSIAVAAGLRYPQQDVPRIRPNPTPFQRSSLSRPPMSVDDATSPPTSESTTLRPSSPGRSDNGLTELKIDAWLGEWLSAGYFDKSEQPPPSEELVKQAKATLKKPPEEIKGADLGGTINEFDEIDWADKQGDQKEVKELKSLPTHEKTGLRAMAAKGYAMPRRARTVSLSMNSNANGPAPTSEPIGRRPRSSTYTPPIPTYSLAPQDTIPPGFVAHARDSCIDTDFEWDSQKEPLNWGDGGQYEEEWSVMHRRFGNGLQSILAYYGVDQFDDVEMDDVESEEEQVLILVTHQAGCNALIRLVTGAPSLHDVGTASLTMAVRKPALRRKESTLSMSPLRRRGSLDLGIDDEFDMKVIASTEHLRSGSNPLGLNSPRLAMSPAFASRKMVGAESLEGFSIGDPLTWRSASQSSLPVRSSSMRGHAPSGSFESLSGTGLWSRRDTRSSSISSDVSVSIDPRSVPSATPKTSSSNISGSVILEDEALEDWASSNSQSHIIASPVSIESQSVWQSEASPKKKPVRSASTRLSGSATAGTGLWGSPVTNPGGVKEGTPHSRGSFGMADSATPVWGARSSSLRNS